MMKNIKVGVVVPNNLSNGVVDSQIGSIITMFTKINCDVFVRGEIRNSLFNDSKFSGTKVDLIRSVDILYIRSFTDFIYFKALSFINKDIKIIYDFRGLVFSESYFRNKSWIRMRIIRIFEFIPYRFADYVLCVSNNMKSALRAMWGERPVLVVPCCVPSSGMTLKVRAATDVVRFVYVGGMYEWQKFQQIAEIHKSIRPYFDNITFDVYTSDVDMAISITSNVGIDVRIQTLSHSDLIRVLGEYDFGYIFRDDCLVNNVACPIKMSEYICSGVYPIVTSGVGDYVELINCLGVGVVLNLDDNNSHVIADRIKFVLNNKNAQESISIISKIFSHESYLGKLKDYVLDLK